MIFLKGVSPVKSICIKTISEDKVQFLIEQFEKFPISFYISHYRFKTYDNVIVHCKEEDSEEFYEISAIIIKKCIEKFYEEKFVRKNVVQNYFYLSSIEQEYICEITKKILTLPDNKIGYKNKILKKTVLNYIQENKAIVLEGFVNFRIGEYKKILDNIVEVSVFSYLDLTSF